MSVDYRLVKRTLIIDLGTRRPVLSSAPRGGGFTHSRYILNHQVAANPVHLSKETGKTRWEDPTRYLGKLAGVLAIDTDCVALMTAVPLTKLAVVRMESAGLWVQGYFTVGLTNAVRAGEPPRKTAAGRELGTINIVLVTNGRLTRGAMVGAVQVATEAKTAKLLEEQVQSWTGRPGATGTGTDAIVIAAGDGPALCYSGTHTGIGALIGRVVMRGMAIGLRRWRRWSVRPREGRF